MIQSRTMAFYLFVILIIITNFYTNSLVQGFHVQQSPEVLAGLYQGDIKLAPRMRGVAIRDRTARWINNIIPYEISSVFSTAEKTTIENSMRKIEQLTAINNALCVQFRPKIATDRNYVSIINDTGCYSYVGRINAWTTGQVLSLQKNACVYEGTIMHELIHTLGFSHEQSRPDRDSYVRVNYENIQTGQVHNFEKKTITEADTLNTPYDYASIMHYGPFYFSANGLKTIEPIQSNAQIGQRTNLSPIDIQEIQLYYNCSAKGATTTAKPTTVTTAGILSSGRWSMTAQLSTGRVHHTSNILPDGRVITIGGDIDGTGVELYNPVTKIWSRGASMIGSRTFHTATLLPDGRLFVAGGYYNKYLTTAEIYNPVSNTWSAVSSMNIGRHGHQAIYLPSPWNKILVMGGDGNKYNDSQSCELYDFASNKWTFTTPMSDLRSHFTATYLPSLDKVVAIGGSYPSRTAEIYTVSSAQWTRSANGIPDLMFLHTATLIPSIGQVLVVGGTHQRENVKMTYLFNPTTNSFTFAANTTVGRLQASATLLPSDLVLITGGLNGNLTIERSAEIYDYRSNTWRSVASMNVFRYRHKSVLLNSSSLQSPVVLVIGGAYEVFIATPTCELFSVNG